MRSVHDLHVWTVTAGFGALAAHVVVARGADRDLIRRRLELILRERFGIEHTTLQMEEEADGGPAAGRERARRTGLMRKPGCSGLACGVERGSPGSG